MKNFIERLKAFFKTSEPEYEFKDLETECWTPSRTSRRVQCKESLTIMKGKGKGI